MDDLDSLRCKPHTSRLRIERFKLAQDQPHAGFDNALSELRSGQKTGHWIWYVFPQLAGLGGSQMSQVYGIAGLAEACEYLRDPLLRSRLLTAATAVVDQHRAGVALRRLMGSSIDLLKLVSSMTLFGEAARRMEASEPSDEGRRISERAEEILRAAKTEGYPRCQFTLRRLADR